MDIGHEIISSVILSSSAHSKKAIVNYCLVAKLPLHIQFDQWDSETKGSYLGPFGPSVMDI